jgi:hypothetical protein
MDLHGTGAPQYRFIIAMLPGAPGTFEIDRPFAAGSAEKGALVSVDVVKAQNVSRITSGMSHVSHFLLKQK